MVFSLAPEQEADSNHSTTTVLALRVSEDVTGEMRRKAVSRVRGARKEGRGASMQYVRSGLLRTGRNLTRMRN